jgi:hypothetical protein
MELEQWLIVYRAVTQSGANKERGLWSLFAGFFLGQCVLLLALVFSEAALTDSAQPSFRLGLTCLGLVIALLGTQALIRLRRELLHMEKLLRQMESQFAGGEVQRGLFRLAKGAKVCVTEAEFICNEWLPSVSRHPLFARVSAPTSVLLISTLLVAGWLVLLLGVVAL